MHRVIYGRLEMLNSLLPIGHLLFLFELNSSIYKGFFVTTVIFKMHVLAK